MKVTLIPSATSSTGIEPSQFLVSYLINETIAIDAGCLGFYGTPDDQAKVRNVLITHTHIDHVASLPIFLENVFVGGSDSVTVHGSAVVLDGLQRDLFNGRIWPDFIGMSTPAMSFVRLNTIEANKPFELDGIKITPIAVNHLIPTLGFILEDGKATVVIPSDTGPTDEIWRVAAMLPNLRAVFLEAAFPNKMAGLAKASKHLTPAEFGIEAAKIPSDAELIAIHIKSRFRQEIIAELDALRLPNLTIGEFGRTYEF